MVETAFQCDDVLWRRFSALCRKRDETPDAVLRDLVRLEVHRCERRKARRAEGIEQRLLARLRFSSLRRWLFPKAGVGCNRRFGIEAFASHPRAAA